MRDRLHPLLVTKQAKVLGSSRGSVYYRPKPVSEYDQGLMPCMDRLYMEWPFAGARMLRDLLRQEGFTVGRKHVGTLMRGTGLEALYQKPQTTQRHPVHQVYPYLLRDLAIIGVKHVGAMDVTYVPMAKGFVYLVTVVDWAMRIGPMRVHHHGCPVLP